MREKVPGLIRILFIGDIVGKPGRLAVRTLLPRLVGSEEIDFVIANAENGAGVAGLTPKVADELLENGVDLLTSGNHIWRKKEIEPYLEESSRVLRPANYPAGVVGKGHGILKTAGGTAVGVINLEGRVFMSPLESPFRVGDELISRLSEKTKIIVVDFHAEATSEKQALGWYFDGRVSAVVGTHTHVQTADEQIRASGTAYITDVGMTGATDSIIGIRKEEAIAQLITQTPKRFTPAKGGLQLQAVLIDVSPESGHTEAIERICLNVDG
ncbi:MAG: TIGR00282 family metallophosphoesterase [Syntrophobacteria bacterium]|jgi:metallophosphoesterase (TIGR00282 family)